MITDHSSDQIGVGRRAVGYALGVATLLGVIETVKAYVAGRYAPNEFGWDEAFLTNFPWWLMWGLMAVVVFRLVHRFPLVRESWPRSVSVHAAASVVLSMLHLFVSAVIVWAAVSHEFLTVREQLRQLVFGYLSTDLVTYWAIVAAYGAWVAQRHLQRSEREQHELELENTRLEADTVRLQSQMTEARLEALRRELNPHFLFNTLNSVSALAQRGDGEEAVVALSRLSELLRRVLDDDVEQEISLEEEVRLLALYLDIVRLRYGDRLEIHVQVDPAVRSALVPSLILQPLVENAVQHGVEAIRGNGELCVEARARGDSLELRVRDSGTGFNPESSETEGNGIGLRNTRSRLETLYGADAVFDLRSVEGGGAEARIRLPLRMEEDVRLRA